MPKLSNKDVLKLIKISHAFYQTLLCYANQVKAAKLVARSEANYEQLYKELTMTIEEQVDKISDIFDDLDLPVAESIN
jgi:hypothetical protein